jgi:RNase P subunit RPR2
MIRQIKNNIARIVNENGIVNDNMSREIKIWCENCKDWPNDFQITAANVDGGKIFIECMECNTISRFE